MSILDADVATDLTAVDVDGGIRFSPAPGPEPEPRDLLARYERERARADRESTLVEIEVKAHKRVISRPRWRRTCGCVSSPIEVSAPLVPRLFRGTPLDRVRPLEMRPVVRETREGRLWNEFVARYHYLGYNTLVGAQMRYAVHDRNGWPLAMLGFSTAAWKLAPRDRFIGWTPEMREKNLPLVVDNPRFLILPWIEIPNLGSHILAIVRRCLPGDWTERYGTTPVLIETFVETPRYTRHRLPGIRLDPCRNHPGPRSLRPRQALRQASQGHLAPATPTGLEAHPQSLESRPFARNVPPRE